MDRRSAPSERGSGVTAAARVNAQTVAVHRREPRRPAVADLLAVAAGVVLVLVAAFDGWARLGRGENLFVFFPPLLASWLPHTGPGTPAAVVVAVAVVAHGPTLAARTRWTRLLPAAWGAAFAWTLSLALVDGWHDGVVGRLEDGQEYLHDLPRVTAPGLSGLTQMLSVFSDHILTTGQDPAQTWFWTTHVGAHPPGAFGLFVVLDRIGLSGGGPAGVVVMLVGTSAVAATAVALRALGAEDLARRALPFPCCSRARCGSACPRTACSPASWPGASRCSRWPRPATAPGPSPARSPAVPCSRSRCTCPTGSCWPGCSRWPCSPRRDGGGSCSRPWPGAPGWSRRSRSPGSGGWTASRRSS